MGIEELVSRTDSGFSFFTGSVSGFFVHLYIYLLIKTMDYIFNRTLKSVTYFLFSLRFTKRKYVIDILFFILWKRKKIGNWQFGLEKKIVINVLKPTSLCSNGNVEMRKRSNLFEVVSSTLDQEGVLPQWAFERAGIFLIYGVRGPALCCPYCW